MADLVLACRRDGVLQAQTRAGLHSVAARIAPDNVPSQPVRLIEGDGVAAVVTRPLAGGVSVGDGGVCLGGMVGQAPQWWRVGSDTPDGTFVIARYDEDTIELLTDVVASRTLWWVMTDTAFVASTSQRAVVALLGDFELDRSAVAWLLSAGTLGPLTSWDARVRALPPDSRLVLDRRRWRVDVARRPAVFAPSAGSREEHVAALHDAIVGTCGALDIDATRWVLPLSGGIDSRVILAGLVRSGVRPRCVTWTTRSSLRDPLSDAFLARRVARRFGVEHEYLFLDGADVDPRLALDRFVAASEGRTDEFAGYVDGLAMWADLADAGVAGVVRGDESMGLRKRCRSDAGSRRAAGATTVDDYDEGHLIRDLGLAAQDFPRWLGRAPEETGETYCDRMDQQVYHSTVLAPLTGIKARYVEVVNPLLSRRVIETVRRLPEDLRVYGRALYAVAARECRLVPYARTSSTPAAGDYLAQPAVVEEIVRCLTGPSAERVLTEEGVVRLLVAMAACSGESASARARVVDTLRTVRKVLPKRLGERLSPRYEGPDVLSPGRLAFRAAIAAKAIALLEEDAGALSGASVSGPPVS